MKSMREAPYCSSVSQQRLEDLQGEYRKKLCRHIDNLFSALSQHGENSPILEKAWSDLAFSITTLFDGNDPKVMRLVLEEVIGQMADVESVGLYPIGIINRLQILLEQDAAWVNEEDELDDQEESMDEDAYMSDREDERQSPTEMLTSNTLFLNMEIGHATNHIIDAIGGQRHETSFADSETAVFKRKVASVTPERGQKEKKTISPEVPDRKKRKAVLLHDSSFFPWNQSIEDSVGMVTPEGKDKQGEPKKEINLSSIPPLVLPN